MVAAWPVDSEVVIQGREGVAKGDGASHVRQIDDMDDAFSAAIPGLNRLSQGNVAIGIPAGREIHRRGVV